MSAKGLDNDAAAKKGGVRSEKGIIRRTMTVPIRNDFHLLRVPTRIMIAFKRLHDTLLKESIAIFRRPWIFKIMNTDVQWNTSILIDVRS